MKRLLREPLLHFLVLGAVIFAAFEFTSKGEAGGSGTILVTQGRIESLAAAFERTWQRRPSGGELDDLLRDYVREEVYYREALALGLDRDDTVIRRRLRQKLEFISGDIADGTEPTDGELRTYLEAHPDLFRSDDRLTFSQVFLDPERHRGTLASDASRLLVVLNRDGAEADIPALGDATLLEHRFENVQPGEVANQFGATFAAQLAGLAAGRWQGPIDSAYGAHLVLVTQRAPARLPPLEEVREAVRREWAAERRMEVDEKLYRSLLGRYTVTIEKPKPEDPGRQVARAK